MWGGLGEEMHVYGEVEGANPRRRQKMTWLEVVKIDLKDLGIASAEALDHLAWRRKVVGDTY